ncbi:MAG: hypothetical protein IJ086_03325 [Clostridium sp.]|uniref:Uncharacterized protein n=1 Tax=Clostridium saudiense TaxID=1414720 RepID=A0ABS2FJK2_9CLOT|nr:MULTISPECIES: hypothetical protein [Clostridiaceae]MBM6820760.1 hypothetical protein [Clostridium saudiense]MBQ8997711.1 hypothetical protein [Clostridium sp.]
MSISDTKKSIISYFIVTIFLILLNYIYSIFSHNVSSNYMTYMFIYPLVTGILVSIFILINKNISKLKSFYIGKSILNYGIAIMVFRSFMKGVFEIAGTDSNYLIYYFYMGLILILVSSILLIYSLYEATKVHER